MATILTMALVALPLIRPIRISSLLDSGKTWELITRLSGATASNSQAGAKAAPPTVAKPTALNSDDFPQDTGTRSVCVMIWRETFIRPTTILTAHHPTGFSTLSPVLILATNTATAVPGVTLSSTGMVAFPAPSE